MTAFLWLLVVLVIGLAMVADALPLNFDAPDVE